jgi:hypothetical protein
VKREQGGVVHIQLADCSLRSAFRIGIAGFPPRQPYSIRNPDRFCEFAEGLGNGGPGKRLAPLLGTPRSAFDPWIVSRPPGANRGRRLALMRRRGGKILHARFRAARAPQQQYQGGFRCESKTAFPP